MSSKLSRQKLSSYAAERLAHGDDVTAVMQTVAAYLIDMGREREAQLLVRDVEAKLLEHGIALADTVSARTLTDEAKKSVEQLIRDSYSNVTKVILRESIDPSVIGGVKVVLPNARLDATVKAKLEKLGV